jgi:hypothetical protein
MGVNTMGHDVDIRVGGIRVRVGDTQVEVKVRQGELPDLNRQDRLSEPIIVQRVERELEGGGFGDPERHPHAWGVFVMVDAALARLYSARNQPREWTSLDRLERWLRDQGFRSWHVYNGLDSVGPDRDRGTRAKEGSS